MLAITLLSISFALIRLSYTDGFDFIGLIGLFIIGATVGGILGYNVSKLRGCLRGVFFGGCIFVVLIIVMSTIYYKLTILQQNKIFYYEGTPNIR